jgi:hypothetical protein
MGLERTTLYRHFPTRLDLLMADLEPRLHELLDGAKKALEIEQLGSGLATRAGSPEERRVSDLP